MMPFELFRQIGLLVGLPIAILAGVGAVLVVVPRDWRAVLGGYALLSVALISNIMAIILQSLCARLAVATGRDLAQACRDAYPRPVAWALWLLAELAICATDLAEVIGTAIGLNLLFARKY